MDTYTETSQVSWLQRLRNAIKAIVFAPLFCALGFFLLKNGEIDHANSTIALKKIEPEIVLEEVCNDGDYIKVNGEIHSTGILTDNGVGFSQRGIKLKRVVSTWQWQERKESRKKRTSGGGSKRTTTYKYKLGWHKNLINSDRFKYREGHINPKNRPYKEKTVSQEILKLDDYTLDDRLAQNVRNYSKIRIDYNRLHNPSLFQFFIDTTNLSIAEKESLNNSISWSENTKPDFPIKALFFGQGTPSEPQVGDTKIEFYLIKDGKYSIVGQKQNFDLQAIPNKDLYIYSGSKKGFVSSSGQKGYFGMVFSGHPTLETMFKNTHDSNDLWYVIMRFGGLLFMVAGFMIFAHPIQIILSWIPFFGFLWEKLVFKIMQLLGTLVSLCISGFYWLKYNQFSNITIYDGYFLIAVLLFLIFVNSIRVEVSSGGQEVYMEEF